MADLIRCEARTVSPDQIPARGEGEVQPILQTLAEETEVMDNSDISETSKIEHQSNGIANSTNDVIVISENDSKSEDDEQTSNGPLPMETNATYRTPNVRVCQREGCGNLAKSDPQWNDEYCSASCVVEHCRDVFDAWASLRRINAAAT